MPDQPNTEPTPAPVDPALQQRITRVIEECRVLTPEALTAAVLAELAPELGRAQLGDRTRQELADLAVNAANALRDEKRHYRIACQEIARLTQLLSQYADRGITNGERAELAERERDSYGRETDRLRGDWVRMRTRAEAAEAALDRVREARERIANANYGHVDAIWCLDQIDAALNTPAPATSREA